MSESGRDVTGLLHAWGKGDRAALDQLTPLVYKELHEIARRAMRRERPGGSLQPTALLNEAFLKLVGATSVQWQDRAHFFAISAQMMRRILVDAARSRGAGKRGGSAIRLQLNEAIDVAHEPDHELVALDDALEALAQFDPRKAKVVELRYFGGLSVDETAEVLHISPQSVLRDWKLARAWLLKEMGGA
jgi:RNA polymerase sigma-70 factor, ECF subfamily